MTETAGTAQSADLPANPATAPQRQSQWLKAALISIAVAALAWTLAYLAVSTPGPWIGQSVQFPGSALKVSRGAGRVEGSRMIVHATDATGMAIIALDTPPLSADEYRRIRWKFSGLPPGIALLTLWRTDVAPGKVFSAPLAPDVDTATAIMVPGERGWSGNVGGIALTVRGALQQPLVIERVSIAPMSAIDVLADRAGEWFGAQPWNGMSINTAIGGPPEQPAWPLLVAAILALTGVALCALWLRRAGRSLSSFPLAIVAIIGAAWLLLDARWLWLRVQQAQATIVTFSGKPERDRHLADIDGYVYAFTEQVRARMPQAPARVFVAADDHYFGGRVAYHLLPHNAFVDHGTGKLPASSIMKPGDYVVVFRRKDVRFDLDSKTLSWDDQPAINADVLLAHRGNALFKVR